MDIILQHYLELIGEKIRLIMKNFKKYLTNIVSEQADGNIKCPWEVSKKD